MDAAEKHLRRKLRDLRTSHSGTRRAIETAARGRKPSLLAKLEEVNRAIAELEGQIELLVKRQKTLKPVIMQPGEGRSIGVIGDVYRFLATGEDTAGRYAMWEAIVPPGGGPPPHIHSRDEEGLLVLEREITFNLDDERLVATAGKSANMPVGSLHCFKNETRKPARMLISVAPAGLEKSRRAMASRSGWESIDFHHGRCGFANGELTPSVEFRRRAPSPPSTRSPDSAPR